MGYFFVGWVLMGGQVFFLFCVFLGCLLQAEDAVLDGLAVRSPRGQLEALLAVDRHFLVGEGDLPRVAARVREDRSVVV